MWSKKKEKMGSQSGGSNFTIPGPEGLLVILRNDKLIGVTLPRLEIRVQKKTNRAIQAKETGLFVIYGIVK